MKVALYETWKKDDGRAELVMEDSVEYMADRLDSPQKIHDMFCRAFRADRMTEEHVWILCCDVKMKPVGVMLISRGTCNASLVRPREVFMKALLCNASNIALIHNHPSGDATPSADDYNVWRILREAGELLGVSVVDSIIVGNDVYYSFKEHE